MLDIIYGVDQLRCPFATQNLCRNQRQQRRDATFVYESRALSQDASPVINTSACAPGVIRSRLLDHHFDEEC